MSSLIESLAEYVKEQAEVLENGKNRYFCDFRKNIFREEMDPRIVSMFMAGDGNELVSKACAPHSSSMLGYNFFHWIKKGHELEVTFDQDGKTIAYDEVFFEVKIPVLKRSRAANMDIVLRNGGGNWLFIESKFTEYMNTGTFDISETYKKPKAYYCLELGKKWTDFITHYDTHLEKQYWAGMKQYWAGIKQEMCHLIGLTNWIQAKTKILEQACERSGDIRFVNLVFEPDSIRFQNEFKMMGDYRHRYEDLHKQLSEKEMIPHGLKMELMTYSMIWPAVQKSNLPAGLKEYLEEHYMQFAKKE